MLTTRRDKEGNRVRIYTLSDKEGNVFYVGKTELPLKTRLQQHFYATIKYPNTVKSKYMIKLKNKVFISCVYDEPLSAKICFNARMRMEAKEIEYMRFYKEAGHPIVNQRSINPRKLKAA